MTGDTARLQRREATAMHAASHDEHRITVIVVPGHAAYSPLRGIANR